MKEVVIRYDAPPNSQGSRSEGEETKLLAEVGSKWARSEPKGPRESAADRLKLVIFRGGASPSSQGTRREGAETKLLAKMNPKWARSGPEGPRESAADRLNFVMFRRSLQSEVVSKRVFPRRAVFGTPLEWNR